MFKALILSVLFLAAPLALASPELRDEFSSTYYTHYTEGKCGQNIQALLTRARARGADLRGARVVVIRNEGYFFSVTHRRNAGKRPVNGQYPGIRFEPGVKNFYFHVALEKDGEIYDYDFGNEPVILPAKDYIRRMFWEEPFDTAYTGLEKRALREKYRISFTPAEEYLRDARESSRAESFVLKAYYDSL